MRRQRDRPMITTLAFRHLRVKPLRSLFLLLGFSLGVGVMVVLLSVGEAMLDQSRDVALVGGGEVTVLPEGIDVEAMRSGGVSGMFFGIDRARYLTRVMLGGPRHADVVRGGRAGHREQAGVSRHDARRHRRRPGRRRDPEPRPGDGRRARRPRRRVARLCRPIPPGWRPLRSSSTTSSTASTSRRGATPPGASGTTSTWCRARRVVVPELSRRRRGARRPLGRPAPRSRAAGRTAATSASPPTSRRSGSGSIPPGPTSPSGRAPSSSGTVSTG